MTYITFIFLVVFLPGLTWETLDKNFASKIKPDKFEFILRSAVFGIVSYLCVSCLNLLCGLSLSIDTLEQALKNTDKIIFLTFQNIKFIAEAEAIAIILGVLWVFVKNTEFYIDFFRVFSKKRFFFPEDVWERALEECYTKTTEPYVIVRDFENGITYEGAVQYFTENDDVREIVLIGASIIHDDKGSMEINRLYLSLDPKKIIMDIIEVQKIPKNHEGDTVK